MLCHVSQVLVFAFLGGLSHRAILLDGEEIYKIGDNEVILDSRSIYTTPVSTFNGLNPSQS
jgi:hypothetical protein